MTQLEKIEQAYLENREIPYTDDKRKFIHMDAVYDETMRAYFYDGFVSRDAEIRELVKQLEAERYGHLPADYKADKELIK